MGTEAKHNNKALFRFLLLLLLALASSPQGQCEQPLLPERLDLIHDRRHFQLDAGEAPPMLNEFSRQSDLQILFDYSVLKEMRTCAVTGDMDSLAALHLLLCDTGLGFEAVNDRTIAVTMRRETLLGRLWGRVKHTRTNKKARPRNDDDNVVLISRLRDELPGLQVGTPTNLITNAELERAGYATVGDFIRTIPSVFGGGPSRSTSFGREAGENSSKGCGFNQYGLDAGATLVLLDGKRIAGSGTAAAWGDVCNLPMTAIDRIDILSGGASTKYGADAVSGIVNFVTKRAVDGAETNASFGAVTSGSLRERLIGQTLGNGTATLSVEVYDRDPLTAYDRAQATSDLIRWGGANYSTPYGFPPTLRIGTQTWTVPLNAQHPVSASDLLANTENLNDQWAGTDILPQEKHYSLLGNMRRAFNDEINVSGDIWLSQRRVNSVASPGYSAALYLPASNPYYINPTGGSDPVEVDYSFGRLLGPVTAELLNTAGGLSTGLDFDVSGWNITGNASYYFAALHQSQHNFINFTALSNALADKNPVTAFNPFSLANNNVTLSSIRATALYSSWSDTRSISVSAGKPVFDIAGKDLSLSVGAEYRKQTLSSLTDDPNDGRIRQSLGRDIASTFASVLLPILTPESHLRYADHLDYSLGLRYDNSGGLSSLTPQTGFVWSLDPSVQLRTTWGRSMRPPALTELSEAQNGVEVIALPDVRSTSGYTNTLLWFGGNSSLRPERARTWTFGLDLHPLDGLSFAATYFNVVSLGRVETPDVTLNVLQDAIFGGNVIRNPSLTQRLQACGVTFFTGDRSACESASVLIDARDQNDARVTTRGADFNSKYVLKTSIGRVSVQLDGTYLFDYSIKQTPDAAPVKLVSTQNYPVDLRLRGSLSWGWRGFEATAGFNYTDKYRDIVNARTVASWTTIDLQLRKRWDIGSRSYRQITFNAHNLFDHGPPFLENRVGVSEAWDQENGGDLLGRMLSIAVQLRF